MPSNAREYNNSLWEKKDFHLINNFIFLCSKVFLIAFCMIKMVISNTRVNIFRIGVVESERVNYYICYIKSPAVTNRHKI